MSGLDALFEPREHVDLSAAAQAWLRRIRAGETAAVEVVRKRSGLSYGPTRLRVVFAGGDAQTDSWDAHLSEALGAEKVRAVSEANEALRLSLMMADWFQYPAQRFGDDYFNSVLWEYLTSGALGSYPEVQGVLRDVHEDAPDKGSHEYLDCLNEVMTVFQRGAHSLTVMGYHREIAERILVKAVAQFLDDRFGVTNRHMLGLL